MSKTKKLGLSDICDFYSLYAMSEEIEKGDNLKPAVIKLREDVNKELNLVTDSLYAAIGQYLYLASFAEARHAGSRCKAFIPDIAGQGWSREQASEAAISFNPLTTLPRLVSLFNEYGWYGSFGGKKWGQIAKAGENYFTNALPKIVYIDNVVSIQHNGGRAFSKHSSANLVGWLISDSMSGYFEQYLDSRASKIDILDPRSNHIIKYSISTMRVHTLFLLRRFWVVIRKNEKIPVWIDAIVNNMGHEKNNRLAFPSPVILSFGEEEVKEITVKPEVVSTKKTLVQAVPSTYTKQTGVYNEYIKQHGEKDREGNELQHKVLNIHSWWNKEGLPPGKYFAIKFEE